MVSGTRYPAWSDQLKKWSESRAARRLLRSDVSQDTGSNFLMSSEGTLEVFRAIFHVIQWELCIFIIFWQFSMLFNRNIEFLSFFCFSYHLIEKLAFSHFSVIHVIQWEICVFFLFCKFSIFYNGNFTFNFPCYSIGT